MPGRGKVVAGIALAAVSIAALTTAVTPGRGEPLAPDVRLSGDTRGIAGKALSFTASTGARLAGAGGQFALELRGIDLGQTPRTTFSRPTYRDPRRCKSAPCRWSVTANTATTFEFRAFLIDVRKGRVAGQSPAVRAVWAAAPQPHALKLLVNGKRMPLSALDGSDDYKPVRAGGMQVEARWTTDARGTGYSVAISTEEPQKRTYAICSTGTSCLVPVKVPIRVDQELSFHVSVITTSGRKIVTAQKLCLVGSRT